MLCRSGATAWMRSATITSNTVWGNRMDALTKVLENVGVFLAAVALLQIADAEFPVVLEAIEPLRGSAGM